MYAYGYHAIGFKNFDHTGFALFTNGFESLNWARVDGVPQNGEIHTSVEDRQTAMFQDIFDSGQKNMLRIYEETRPVGMSPVRTVTYEFLGENRGDFADEYLGSEFHNFAEYIGMPSGLVRKAAIHILGVKD